MDDFATPEEAIREIHRILRHLDAPGKLADSIWLSSCLVTRVLRQAPELMPHQALKQVLTEALADLEAKHADLLHGRFWEGCTVAEMVQAERPVSQEDRNFYLQQRQALERFTALMLHRETRCCQARSPHRLLQRLPMPTYTHLYGVDSYVDQLLGWLHEEDGHAIISIKGIGGIGKTALADYTMRRFLAQDDSLHDLVWISAKQEYLSTAGISGASTQIQLEMLFDDLGYKLGVCEVLRLPLAQKVDRLAPLLRGNPHLVIIDNLETVEDFQRLAPWLERLAGPTRFLLTSREVLPALTTVTRLELGELNREASLALIEAAAQDRAIGDFNPEALYALAGGNPLAILLAVSQIQYLPPREVLRGIRLGTTAEIYTYIYWKSWSVLDDTDREVLFAIQRTGDRADWGWLATVCDLSPRQLQPALQRLLDLSLVQLQSSEQGKRLYAIHRLTSTFLRSEVLGWK